MTQHTPIYVRDCADPTGQIYIDHGGGRLERRVRGHEPTPRMKEIGLAAVWRTGASWLGEFHSTPGSTFELPLPLADWLLDPAQ